MSMINKMFMRNLYVYEICMKYVAIYPYACLTEANLGRFLLPCTSESEFSFQFTVAGRKVQKINIYPTGLTLSKQKYNS